MNAATGLTQDIGRFLEDVSRRGVPAEVREAAKPGFADAVGTLIAGRHEPATATLREALAPLPEGRSALWFSSRRTHAADAALLNGVAAHALDFDDVVLRGHPSAVLVPAIVALAQQLGRSGAQMLDAYAAGYEVWAELVDRETDIHHMKGWHPTGIFGSIAAAAAGAVLYGLDAAASASAVGLGASQSAGLMSNFGAMAKPFHAGRAAQAGVVSARLAAAGFTAAPDALEHPQGFLSAVSPAGRVDRERPADRLGTDWQLPRRRSNLKQYPTCYYTHRALDAIVDLMRDTTRDTTQQVPRDPARIARIDVTMSREHATVLRNHAPRDALAAKFSIEFAMAAALVAGKVGLTELDDAFVAGPAVQALIGRVHVTHADRYDPETPGAAWADHVVLTLDDGRALRSADVHHARGHADLPLRADERRAKFGDCLAYGRYAGDADALWEQLATLERHAATALAHEPETKAAH